MKTTFEVEYGEASPTVGDVYSALTGLVVDLDVDNDGYPSENVYILRVDDDGDVVVCETGVGVPQEHATWAIPQACIQRVIVKLGEYA
jgi:3-isopropylmalate dehydratase small subunit